MLSGGLLVGSLQRSRSRSSDNSRKIARASGRYVELVGSCSASATAVVG